MKNALIPSLGGPVGVHARRDGVFFQPLPWALLIGFLSFVVLYLRHLPCLTVEPRNPINAYIRACYSDIPQLWIPQGWASGGGVLGEGWALQQPLQALFVWVSVWLTKLLGGRVGPGSSEVEQYAATWQFFGASTLLLFACFLVLIVAAHKWAVRRGDPWSVMLVAASPVIFAAGLTSWTLFPVSLVAVGMALLAKRRRIASAIVFGLATGAGGVPWAFVLGVLVALAVRSQWLRLLKFAGIVLVTSLVVHAPVLISSRGAFGQYFHNALQTDVGPGSLWYLAQEAGASLRGVGALSIVLVVLVGFIWGAWVYTGRRVPGAATTSAVIVILVGLVAPSYPPQYGIWVALALFFALPSSRRMWAYGILLALHYLAVWGWLGGNLHPDNYGPWGLYWLAVGLRFAAEVGWLIHLSSKLKKH